MLNAEIIGNLGCDTETRVNNGEKFYTFRIASSYKYANKKTGEIITETTWVSVVSRFLSEGIIQYLKKGTKVFVRGRLEVKPYYGKDGKEHIGINITANEVELCGGKSEEQSTETTKSTNTNNNKIEDSDEPFRGL